MENPIHLLEEILDESPIHFYKLRRYLPIWLHRFIPIGGGKADDEHGKTLFGFTVFLLSESIVFLSFFFTYIALRLTTPNWLPPGVSGPELSGFTIFNTLVLLSSSLVIQLAENALKRRKIRKFRLLWLITSAMGTYFLIAQAIEWSQLNFGLTTGLVGGTFYVLTGFHGLHVLVGVLLQILMVIRSFIRGNYNKGHFGVSATTLFWHFVDGIWVILFSLLYIW
ncbi:cytochrome c oxidase subunit 3 [Brasilonema octagenarum]|uniref:Heme-copper oxidase subunit III n=1 Tax=Brasilonema octagenarum UFV-OR1 TaxID=417115 RepID=A0ABX1MIU6_9CYAN|nr:heme-copper oxidase subunit III [Brasilonema octagenarum]NMF67005.1 heme-copper oxidase subunit III [Brasilonema octagenarum UFV-OR1]